MTDAPAFENNLAILTAPHPATRRAAAFLEAILAANSPPVRVLLVTDADHVIEAGARAIYLRPGVNDALALAVTADLHGPSSSRAACALLAGLDERWHGIPRLSLEDVVDRPHGAVCLVANQLGLVPAETVLSAADRLVTALRNDVTPFLHILPFLAAVEPGEPAIAWMDKGLPNLNEVDEAFSLVSADVPRHMLLVTRSGTSPSPELLARTSDWQLHHVELGPDYVELPALADGLGVIYFDRIHGEGLGDLLDRMMDHLAPGGLLCGEEHTDTIAEAAAAQITKAGEPHQLIFVLSGPRWCAIPPAWWR